MSKKERFLDRFFNDIWIDFGEVFGEVLERFLELSWVPFPCYLAYLVGTGF